MKKVKNAGIPWGIFYTFLQIVVQKTYFGWMKKDKDDRQKLKSQCFYLNIRIFCSKILKYFFNAGGCICEYCSLISIVCHSMPIWTTLKNTKDKADNANPQIGQL